MEDTIIYMKRRPPLLKLIVFVLLGAIVNVAVAWGISMFVDPFQRKWQYGERVESGDYWRIWRWDRPGITYLFSQRGSIPTKNDVRIGTDPIQLATPFPVMFVAPHKQEVRDFQACGWPQLAFCHVTLIESPHGVVKSMGTIDVGLSPRNLPWPSLTKPPRYLSIRPLWPGFAINTIFYAAILWMLFAAPFALRRRRRIKRGLCPACAYPVGSNDNCTECGTPVASRLSRGDGM